MCSLAHTYAGMMHNGNMSISSIETPTSILSAPLGRGSISGATPMATHYSRVRQKDGHSSTERHRRYMVPLLDRRPHSVRGWLYQRRLAEPHVCWGALMCVTRFIIERRKKALFDTKSSARFTGRPRHAASAQGQHSAWYPRTEARPSFVLLLNCVRRSHGQFLGRVQGR